MSANVAAALSALSDALRMSAAPPAMEWFDKERAILAEGSDPERLTRSLPMASRYGKNRPLGANDELRATVAEAVPGLCIERWSQLETMRVLLLCAPQDQASQRYLDFYKDAHRYADEGELRVLFKALPLLEDSGRFIWFATEACRTNIVPVFEAIGMDTPYPAEHFDELAWNQLCLKAIFMGAPLHRTVGLDKRANADLARMALDLVEERRAAGRAIQPELWLCLGEHAGERGLAALEQELVQGPAAGRHGALLGLARAGASERVATFVSDSDEQLAAAARSAQQAMPTPHAFAVVHAT
ncbi:MAG: hypothetical protein ACI8QC_003881 [Planctomycetota bacterium]|jgi:hypothetical protein